MKAEVVEERVLLEACKLVNVDAFYPGRDFVTANRRILAL